MTSQVEKPKKTKIYSIRLTEEQAAMIAEIAQRETRTVSNTIYSIVVNYLSDLEAQKEMTDE
jgi:predicted DNA-binding protein